MKFVGSKQLRTKISIEKGYGGLPISFYEERLESSALMHHVDAGVNIRASGC